jgi:hypothetical protein
MSQVYKYDIFLSHSKDNEVFARQLAAKLRKLEFHVWKPRRTEEQVSKQIVNAMEDSAVCILLFGPDGKSPWADKFVWSAISERIRRTDGRFRVIPILLPTVLEMDDQLISGWNDSWECQQQRGTFIRFGNSLDDDGAINDLVLRIRGVDYGEDSIWHNAVFKEKVRRRAKNVLNVDWLTLMNSISENQLSSCSSVRPQLITPFISNKVLPGYFGRAANDLNCTSNRKVSFRGEEKGKGEIQQDSNSTNKAVRRMTVRAVARHYSSLRDCLQEESKCEFVDAIRYVVWLKEGKENISVVAENTGQLYQPLPVFADDVGYKSWDRTYRNAYERGKSLARRRLPVEELNDIEDNLHDAYVRLLERVPNSEIEAMENYALKAIQSVCIVRYNCRPWADPAERNTRIALNKDDDLKPSWISDEGLIANRKANQRICSWFADRFHKIGRQLVVYIDTLIGEAKSGCEWCSLLPDNPASVHDEQMMAYASYMDPGVASIGMGIDSREMVRAPRKTNACDFAQNSYRDWFMRGANNVSFLEPHQCFSVLMRAPLRSQGVCFIMDGLADNELIRFKISPELGLKDSGALCEGGSLYHAKSASMVDERDTNDASMTSSSSDDGELADLLKVFGVYPTIVGASGARQVEEKP